MKLLKYKAVLFDYDDTLVTTIGPIWDLHKHVAKTEFGKIITDQDMRDVWGIPFPKMISKLYNVEDPTETADALARHAPNYPKIVKPGAIELIAKLRENNILVGMVTAGGKRNKAMDFKNVGFSRDWFFMMQTHEDTSFHKPDPRVFEPILESLIKDHKVSKSDVVYIGDSTLDFEAATKAGLDFIACVTGMHTSKEFDALNSEQVSSLKELL